MSLFTGSRKWVYPLKIRGRFTRYHRLSSVALCLFLGVVPWLSWGGRPLIRMDVAARQLTVFGEMFTASEGVFLMLLLLAAAFGLFFFTALLGRLWCGYACPQSVFQLNFVLPIEEWLEGDRSRRRLRASEPWSFDKAWRKAAKFSIYAALSVVISMSFMGFFHDPQALWTGQASRTAYAVVAAFSALWFLDFVWFREQVCNLVCPYARFQSVLVDKHSLVISYDEPRGEPRGKAAKARGGCIDCFKCVSVCPQGIDIRDGFQLECIACGLCIDACETIMPKLGHPTLVRYSTMAADAGKKTRVVRTRTVAYGAILTALAAGLVVQLGLHAPVELLVDRTPGNLFVEDGDGFIRNTFLVHVADRTLVDGTYTVAVDGLPPGSEVTAPPVQLAAASRSVVPLIVRVPRDVAAQTLPISVRLTGEQVDVVRSTTFKGPGGLK